MVGIRTTVALMLLAALAVVLPHPEARAANYHYGSTLKCSDCHVSHASARHDEAGSGLAYDQPPRIYLTKGASVAEVCLQCHNNQPGLPDVSGPDVNNPSERYDGTERAGGQFAEGSADNWKGHNLRGQGSAGPDDCTACHDPHGNTNYRNLRSADDSGEGIVAYVNPSATGLDKYRRANIAYVKGIDDELCARCHDFASTESTIGPSGRYHRHPASTGALIASISSGDHADAQHWVTGSGSGFELDGQALPRVPFAVSSAADYAAASPVSAENEVICLSCHKAHGSGYAFGMTWGYGTGDGRLSSSGCNQCHNVSGV